MKDDYIHLFVRRPVRRSPIINRGMVSLLHENRVDIPSIFFRFYVFLVSLLALLLHIIS